MSIMPSPIEVWVSDWLNLSEVSIPLGVGLDVLWPLIGMASYVLMAIPFRTSVSNFKGLDKLKQAYNIFIIVVSAAILLPTIYFRLLGATSWQKAYCPSGSKVVSDGLRVCLWAYHMSKYAEYADTVFLIVQGKEVGNLHFWHHLVVTFTSWTWFRAEVEWVADGVIFNTFVHCLMYYYYYLTGMGIRPWWKKYVTSLQILQFVTSFIATSIWAYYHFTVGCHFLTLIGISVAFNGWLLLMFVSFYLSSYGNKKK